MEVLFLGQPQAVQRGSCALAQEYKGGVFTSIHGGASHPVWKMARSLKSYNTSACIFSQKAICVYSPSHTVTKGIAWSGYL